MKRRTFYLFLTALVVGFFSHGKAMGSNELRLPGITMQSGETAFLSILMSNDDPITGFQCDLYLPKGISIDSNNILLGRTSVSHHGVTTRQMDDGGIRFVCASATNATFSGNSGEVLICRLTGSLSPGQYEMTLKNIILTDPDARRYTTEDVTDTIIVLDSNRLELSDITVPIGSTEQTLPILLNCESQISGFQCDLYLPEGAEVVESEEGIFQIDLNQTISVDHSVSARKMDDGALRIVCSSMKGSVFSDNNSEVLRVRIRCNLTSGCYSVSLKNIVLTNPDAARFTTNDVSCNIYVAEQTIITANSYTITYGDAIPELGYTVEGAELDGEPEIVCEATATSPVGEYPIVIKKGSVTNYNDTYINGTLTITKAPLTISVQDAVRVYGEENPEFVLTFEGFVNEEDETVLTAQPVVQTEADTTSDAGEYALIVSGAEAQNYTVSYTNGTLTIEKAPQEIIWEQEFAEEVMTGDTIALTAHSSCDLPVTYVLSNSDVAVLYEEDGNMTLICTGEGTLDIRATQEGDKNHLAAEDVTKTVVVFINGIGTLTNDSYEHYYRMEGTEAESLSKGFYIVVRKNADGTRSMKKVFVR